jgi:hypothetical protein
MYRLKGIVRLKGIDLATLFSQGWRAIVPDFGVLVLMLGGQMSHAGLRGSEMPFFWTV